MDPAPRARSSLPVTPSKRDARALTAFWCAIEPVLDKVETAEREAIERTPALAAVLTKLDRELTPSACRRFEREALRDGQWQSYERQLRARGQLYARLGLTFSEWYALLTPFRRAIHESYDGLPLEQSALALTGLEIFVQIAVTTIGDAYLDAHRALYVESASQLGLYIAMFRSAPVGMLIYEWLDESDLGSFRLMAANPMAEQVGSAPIAKHVGHTLRETSAHVLTTHVPEHFAAAITHGQTHSWTIENLGRIHEVRSFPLHGRHLGLIFDDVTEHRRMAAEIERHVKDLERSNRELDDFAYVASHDLKAPLRDIDNLATWIVEDAGDMLHEASRRHLALLKDRIQRMEHLLDDLLEYSRAGRISAPSEEFELSAAIADAVAITKPPDRFEVTVSEIRALICTPRVPLDQILRNLVQNAIKHHHRDRGQISIHVRDLGQALEIAVSDDGPGIAPEFHERVFRMFQTLRPRDDVEGSGMGLAIVSKLVESHGGKVWLESTPGVGTTMRFTWPKTWPPRSEHHP